jgi:hypothetical protein
VTRDEAIALLSKPIDEAVDKILALAEKAEKYDQLCGDISPTTPTGMTPVYLKPPPGKRKKKPGRENGHRGISRRRPEKVDDFKEHKLKHCPQCHSTLKRPVKSYKRYIEDIPPVEPVVTEHTVYGYWCSECKKVVLPKVTDALPNAMIGLRVVVFTAWLHYLIGISVNNVVKILNAISGVNLTPGGLTQAWNRLASLLEPRYDDIGQKVSQSAVLNADETGWRLNGITHWLWCFTTQKMCYYLITKSRGSPVVKEVLGTLFKGILICDFWGAYNKISALAKQRCFYHLFTELRKVDKHNSSDQWKSFRKKLLRLLKDAIRLSHKKVQLGASDYVRLNNRLSTRLDQFLNTTYEDKDAKRLIKRLKRHRNELFTFLKYEGVSPYNNHAEQQMRKPVLSRKVSQQNRSEQGAKTQAILMTLFRSSELQGENPVETVIEFAQKSIVDEYPATPYFNKAA